MNIFFSSSKFDSWMAVRMQRVVNKWCSVTGKDNFVLARLAAKVCILLLVVAVFVSPKLLGNVGGYFLAFVLIFIWTWLVRSEVRQYEVIERMVERWESGTADISYQEAKVVRSICYRRQSDLFLGTFWLIIGIIPPIGWATVCMGFAILMFSFGGYAALSLNGGGTSAWQRAKEKVTEWARRAADALTPAPSPVPIPVRVR